MEADWRPSQSGFHRLGLAIGFTYVGGFFPREGVREREREERKREGGRRREEDVDCHALLLALLALFSSF